MKQLSAAVCLLALAACSGRPNWLPPPASERLDTQIAADGTKFFVFHRSYLRPTFEDRVPQRGSPSARQRQREGSGSIYAELEVEERLTAIMERTGYCQEGFFELYRQQTFNEFWVRGECREGATDADREQFSDQSIALNSSAQDS